MPAEQPIDLQSPAFVANPYPVYRSLQAAAEPYWLPHVDRTGTEGLWMFTRYDEVAAILRDTEQVSKDISRLVPADKLSTFDRMLLNMDPPQHTRLRAVIAPLFSVRAAAALERRIERLVDELISDIEPGGESDFVAQFATPLPLRVVAGVIGVPSEDMPRLKQWTDDMITGFDSATASDETQKRAGIGAQDLAHYLAGLSSRGVQPEGSLLDHLNIVRREVGMPTTDEVLSLSMLLVLAGHETTVNLLGSGLLTLLRNPGQLERLRKNPELISTAIEEMLRFESPLQRGTYRITTAQYRIGGVTLERGQQLSAVIGAANRDPDQFPDPDVFDIARRPNRHLSFGKGVHKCLGERLAKAEARIALTKLLERFPGIALLDEQPQWQHKTLFRGLRSLKVIFET